MTRHLGSDPSSSHDETLAALLADAVADVEPADRLGAIRAQTAGRRATHRRWYVAAGAAALAGAAAVAAIAVVDHNRHEAPDPAGDPSHLATTLVPAYFLGDTARGPRLFREFDREQGEPLAAALTALQQPADDPDYRTAWPAGSLTDASVSGTGAEERIDVVLAGESLRERPVGMSEQEAALAVQQVVYTLQGTLQSRVPVVFRLSDGTPLDRVLGVPTTEPVRTAPQLEVLNLVQINDPAEGTEVEGSFTATGRASSHEATVPWELKEDDRVVRKGFATAEGWMGLYRWETTVDVSDLAPGTYTFVAMTADPSGGAEGFGPDEDTRTIVVR